MATVKYYLDPAGAADIDQAPTVAHSLLSRWPDGHGVPRGLRIYRGDVACQAQDVTQNHGLLLTKSDDTYTVVVTAAEPTTIIAIVSVVISVASVLLAPSVGAPPPNANRTQQSPNNFLGTRSNQARVGQRSADIRGTQRGAYPDLLQVPYRRFRDGIEYEYIYAQVSEGYCAVSDIRDGATLFERIRQARLAVYGPGTSPLSGSPQQIIRGAPTEGLYEITQSNEIDGVTLLAPNSSELDGVDISVTRDGGVSISGTSVDFTEFLEVGDSVTLDDFYYFGDFEPEIGYFRYDLNGTYEITAITPQSISTTADWTGLIPAGDSPYTLEDSAWTNGSQWYLIDPGDPSFVQVFFYPLIGGLGQAGPVGPADVSGYDRIIINTTAEQGVYKDDGTKLIPTSVFYRVVIHELTSGGARTGNTSQETGVLGSLSTNVKQSTGDTVEMLVPYALAEVTVERTSAADKTFAGTVVDEIKWRDLFLANDVVAIDDSYITTVHAEIAATVSALRVKERKLNCAVTRLVEEYSNGTFSGVESLASDLFADVVASIWRDPLFGRGDDDEVNFQQLYDLQAEMLTYYGSDPDPLRVGYTFDSDKITAEEAIKLICNAANVQIYRIGSVMNFWFEGPQSQSAMQFGHRFKHPGTDKRSRTFGPKDDKTGIELTYFDEVTESFETITRGDPLNPLKIEYSGCITARGAQIRADREWNKLRYARIQHTFDATAIGRMVVPGMRVDVIDNTRYAPFNGEVRGTDGLTLTISQPVTLDIPTDYSVVLTRSDGTLESLSITGQPSPDRVTVATAPSEAPQVSRSADRTAYSIATDDERTSLAMLVKEVNPRDYNKVGLAAINYDARYYQSDIV